MLDFRKRRKGAEWPVNNVSRPSMGREMARCCVIIFVAIREIKADCIAIYYINILRIYTRYDCFNISQIQNLLGTDRERAY